MKYKVVGISKPQYTKIGLIKPDSVIEVIGADLEAKADRIKYLTKIKNNDEEDKCQKNEKQSQPIRKPLSGGQKLRLTKRKENY